MVAEIYWMALYTVVYFSVLCFSIDLCGIVLHCLSRAYPTHNLGFVFMFCLYLNKVWLSVNFFSSSDLRKQQSINKYVTFDEGYKFAQDNQLYYAETSALTMDGLNELFEKVVSFLKLVNYLRVVQTFEGLKYIEQCKFLTLNTIYYIIVLYYFDILVKYVAKSGLFD